MLRKVCASFGKASTSTHREMLLFLSPLSLNPSSSLWTMRETLTVQFSGFSERVRKMHHMRGVKRPAGMGGPHCDHSPSSLICSHYPYQRLKIKNKDRESDGGQREAAWDRERGENDWRREGQRDGCMCFCASVPVPAICPLFGGCSGVDGSDAGSGRAWKEGRWGW